MTRSMFLASQQFVLLASLLDDRSGPVREIDGTEMVFGAIAHFLIQESLRGLLVPLGSENDNVVEAGNIVVRRCGPSDVDGLSGSCDVFASEGVGDDDVGDVDHCAREGLVQPFLAIEEPAPADFAELVERLTVDQTECGVEVALSGGAPRLAPGPEASEQVGVEQDILELVGGDPGLDLLLWSRLPMVDV
ncbi:MAG: hypothetical protein ACRDVZ_05700, partial [Jiangellaceae bacterium]